MTETPLGCLGLLADLLLDELPSARAVDARDEPLVQDLLQRPQDPGAGHRLLPNGHGQAFSEEAQLGRP